MKYHFVFLIIVLASFMSGCKEDYLLQRKMDKGYWMNTDTILFNVKVESGKKVPFFIENTYTNAYPFQNIYVKVWAKSPKGEVQEALLLDSLTEYTGQWRVEGGGNEVIIPFKSLVPLTFTETGEYSFKMIHYMRKDTLYGVNSVEIKEVKP